MTTLGYPQWNQGLTWGMKTSSDGNTRNQKCKRVTHMTVEWTQYKDQDHIICYTFYEPWTLEELNAVDDDVLQAVKDSKETFDVIMDLSHVYSVPRNLVSGGVSRIKRFESNPHIGVSVVVHAKPLLETLVRVARKLAVDNRIFLAKDFVEAEQIIAAHRAGCPSH